MRKIIYISSTIFMLLIIKPSYSVDRKCSNEGKNYELKIVEKSESNENLKHITFKIKKKKRRFLKGTRKFRKILKKMQSKEPRYLGAAIALMIIGVLVWFFPIGLGAMVFLFILAFLFVSFFLIAYLFSDF